MNPKVSKILLGCALASALSVLCCRPTLVYAQNDGNAGDPPVDTTVDNTTTGNNGGTQGGPGAQNERSIPGEQRNLGWHRGWEISDPGFDCTPTPTPTPPPARCGDDICDREHGEDSEHCPDDCGFCGDNDCGDGETLQNCPNDCSTCGDNVCSPNEAQSGQCPQDCPRCGDGLCNPLCETPQNCPADCHDCGDGQCTPPSETVQSCPQDCARCGDGVCSPGETCPQDCRRCGDGTCDSNENLQNCPQDCTRCGDGFCSAGENSDNCLPDCPRPPPTQPPPPTHPPTPPPTPPILNCPPDRPLNCNQTLHFCACGRCADDPFTADCLGCFSPETKIAMADGSSRSIAKITAGDMVWNPVTKTGVRVKYPTMGPEKIPMWKIGFDTTAVVVTEGHPMVVNNDLLESEWSALSGILHRSSVRNAPRPKLPETFSVKKAMDVKVGDFVLAADGEYHRVNLVQELPVKSDQVVINLMLDTDSTDQRDHMISADGVITGDLYLQERLEKPATK